ncbi:MAG: energy-coupling factor ABC transporter substrate-binding protein [Caloramator sp.]|nr:energy-coupling factor ABC transporter substrate-binding protein [Caloramator sp.]
MSKKNIFLILLVILLTFAPLFLLKNAEFAGADDRAESAITEINKDYKPWFSSIWEPPSGEVESLLFSLQSAIGAGIVCYYIGYIKGKSVKGSVKK